MGDDLFDGGTWFVLHRPGHPRRQTMEYHRQGGASGTGW